jgi:CheY-like chemotaxis protein
LKSKDSVGGDLTSELGIPLALGCDECAPDGMETLRVLVAEDNALIALLLGEILAGMGHEVCATVATEREAVIAAAHYKPNLMIVDAGLGPGSGISAMEAILRTSPIAHVFISGDANRVRLNQPNAIVVRKPFRQAELARAIEMAVAAPPDRRTEGLCGSGNSH